MPRQEKHPRTDVHVGAYKAQNLDSQQKLFPVHNSLMVRFFYIDCRCKVPEALLYVSGFVSYLSTIFAS